MQLGMIGLGRMGGNMVRRLMRGGHQCSVFDLSPANVSQLAGEGAVAVEAEAEGAFTEGEVHGTLGLRFVDQPDCDAPPIAWSTAASAAGENARSAMSAKPSGRSETYSASSAATTLS